MAARGARGGAHAGDGHRGGRRRGRRHVVRKVFRAFGPRTDEKSPGWVRRRLEAREKACVGERRGARGGSVAVPVRRDRERPQARRARRARGKNARRARSPRRAISCRSVCFFHRFARRAIEGGGGVPRGDAGIGRGAHLTSVELECRGSARVTREPPQSRARGCAGAPRRGPYVPSHAGPRPRLINIARAP